MTDARAGVLGSCSRFRIRTPRHWDPKLSWKFFDKGSGPGKLFGYMFNTFHPTINHKTLFFLLLSFVLYLSLSLSLFLYLSFSLQLSFSFLLAICFPLFQYVSLYLSLYLYSCLVVFISNSLSFFLSFFLSFILSFFSLCPSFFQGMHPASGPERNSFAALFSGSSYSL